MKKLKMIGLAALMTGAMGANAATVTFNFVNADNGTGFTSGSKTFLGSDGTSTVDASATNSSYPDLVSYIDSAARGLYVCTGSSLPTDGTCGAGYGDQPHADGVGANETVILDFGRQVQLVSATFHSTFSGDFDLGADGNPVGDEITLATLVSLISYDATGRRFTFTADGDDDWFKMTSITVKEVPLPGTLGLLGLGLAALGSRRRKAA